jgi:hemolysin activation/secretion protein
MTGPWLEGLLLAAFACVLTSVAAIPVAAQPFERPGEERPELPEPAAPEAPGFVLPPLPEPPPEEKGRLSRGPRLVLREIRVTGSTVFSEAELAAVTEPYIGRPVGSEDLEELRQKLTLLYVDAGYVNSGAVLPDQTVEDGTVEYRIVEGELSQIEIQGNRYFRPSYFRRRLERAGRAPLNVHALQRELQIFQQDPRIRRVNAELAPGAARGEGVLQAKIEEELPYRASLQLSNYESPSIGAYRARVRLAHENLTGNGDILRTRLSFTEGLQEYEGQYEIPVTVWDTTLGAHYTWGESDVVESPFDQFDIKSRSQTVGLEVHQPVYRSLRQSLELSLIGEWRESKTYLFGDPFSFTAGPDDGRSVVSVVRFRLDWLYRDLSQVFAFRSMWSVGLDALGSTVNGGDVPDSQFFAWLGQFQWARRFDPWGWEVVFRTDVQLASSPLLSLEQFSVGGHDSVRGYRENELVRDNGLVSSLEVRVPLWRDVARRPLVQLAVFGDIGRSWNTDRKTFSPRTLYSVGAGLRFNFTRYLHSQIYWGYALRDVPTPQDRDLQDDGVQFETVVEF